MRVQWVRPVWRTLALPSNWRVTTPGPEPAKRTFASFAFASRRSRVHLLSRYDRVARIYDDGILRSYPRDNFDLVAVVAAENYRDEFRSPIADDRDTQTFGAKEKRVRRNCDRVDFGRKLQMHGGVGAG